MGGCWTWLFTLVSLFWNFHSFCISEENESDIWNKIALINESNDGKWLALFQSPSPNVKQVNSRLPSSISTLTYATSFKSITSSQQWTKQPKPTYCYEGKRIMKVH